MTAEDFADLVGARLVSRGKWVGRCPAHRDYHRSLIITKGYKGCAKVECLEHCPIQDILEFLELSRHEFESWPAPLPDLFEMSHAELKAFRPARSERQARHAEACTRIRDLKREVKSIQEEIRTRSHDGVSPELKRDLDETEQRLYKAKTSEVKLRDLDPSFQLWDAERR